MAAFRGIRAYSPFSIKNMPVFRNLSNRNVPDLLDKSRIRLPCSSIRPENVRSPGGLARHFKGGAPHLKIATNQKQAVLVRGGLEAREELGSGFFSSDTPYLGPLLGLDSLPPDLFIRCGLFRSKALATLRIPSDLVSLEAPGGGTCPRNAW